MSRDWHPDAIELANLAWHDNADMAIREHVMFCTECADDIAMLKRPMSSVPEWAQRRRRS